MSPNFDAAIVRYWLPLYLGLILLAAFAVSRIQDSLLKAVLVICTAGLSRSSRWGGSTTATLPGSLRRSHARSRGPRTCWCRSPRRTPSCIPGGPTSASCHTATARHGGMPPSSTIPRMSRDRCRGPSQRVIPSTFADEREVDLGVLQRRTRPVLADVGPDARQGPACHQGPSAVEPGAIGADARCAGGQLATVTVITAVVELFASSSALAEI